MNFPRTHYLSRGVGAAAQADVIMGLELSDFWAVVNSYTDIAEWKASVAFRWRKSVALGATRGWLQPVRHVHRMRLEDLQGIQPQIRKVESVTGTSAPTVRVLTLRGWQFT